ncbi:hypothetical protein [Fodinicola acaciae]|uniref:hypothetical protein n=1 Tax=Fodinicola acaciae TaxID=2681555 RepID=UPI0013D5E6BB|nr:hypothetical protein [Fodinicola acaciae]
MTADKYLKTDYSKIPHEQLYNQLHEGKAGKDFDDAAALYDKQRLDAHTLAGDIGGDLRKLEQVWKGEAFDAYKTAVGAISTFAEKLGDDFSTTFHTLSGLKPHLAQALKDMPNPKDTDDNDSTIGGAAAGAAAGTVIAGPVGTVAGGIVGGIFGHDRDEQQRKAAHAKAAQVVSTYAQYLAGAGVNATAEVPQQPPHLPTHVNTSSPTLTSTSAGPGTTGAPAHLTVDKPADPKHGPTTTPVSDPPNLDQDRPTTTPPPSTVGTPPVGTHTPSGAGLAGGGVGALPATGLGGGGLASAGIGGASAGAPGLAGGTAGAGGAAGLFGTGSGQNLGVGGARGAKKGAGKGTRGGAGAGRRGEDDQPEEYETWLTEDEMVWGNDTDAPPPVLGEKS